MMAVLLSELTVNSFGYMLPAILLLAVSISNQISVERAQRAQPKFV
jgi:hypothetical protein